jgi:hypothetical protein
MPRRSECGGSACGWVKPISAALGRRVEAFNPRADDQGTAEKTFGGYFLISGEARR